ncbi:hypothetical protein D9M70_642220 [compost metagenome]
MRRVGTDGPGFDQHELQVHVVQPGGEGLVHAARKVFQRQQFHEVRLPAPHAEQPRIIAAGHEPRRLILLPAGPAIVTNQVKFGLLLVFSNFSNIDIMSA